MSTFLLEVQSRNTQSGNPRQLRRRGLVPGVVYGPGRRPQTVLVPMQSLVQAIRRGGEHHPITVRLGEQGPEEMALIKDVQWEMFRPEPMHVDLMLVNPDQPVTAEVPIRVTGEQKLRKRGLIVQWQTDHLPVEALPTQLPDQITVPVQDLDEGAAVAVGNLEVPAGVEVKAPAEQIILTVVKPFVPAATEPEPAAGEVAATGESGTGE